MNDDPGAIIAFPDETLGLNRLTEIHTDKPGG
jgi:hypothetical protein